MSDWSDVRQFGARLSSQTYVPRPGAYGFILDDLGRIAVVRSEDGVFLPGGGIENGETSEQALIRETLEECGLLVRVDRLVTRAVQFSYSTSDAAWYEKLCWFFATEIEAARASAQLPGHEILWLAAPRAIEALSHESQRWALSEWASKPGT